MLSPQEVMEKYPEEVNEFFKVLFALSDEQTAAMDKVIPMTQELFESCFEKLMSVDAIRSCMKLMEEYPEFTDTMTENIMNELDLTEEDFQPLSEEESRAGLQALKERIARETGAAVWERKFMKRKILIGVIVIIAIGAVVAFPKINGQMKFNKAIELIGTGTLSGCTEGVKYFSEIKELKEKQIIDFSIKFVNESCDNHDMDSADSYIRAVRNSDILSDEILEELNNRIGYAEAEELEKNNQYMDAYYAYTKLGNYEDSENKASNIFDNQKDIFYEEAVENFNSGIREDVMLSKVQFEKLDGYEDSNEYLKMYDFLNEIIGTYSYKSTVGSTTFADEKYSIDYGSVEYTGKASEILSSKATVISIDNELYLLSNFYDNKNSGEVFSLENGKVHFRYADIDESNNYHLSSSLKTDKILKRESVISEEIKNPSVGMTADEVKQSTWGEPEKINKSTYSWGTSEQWCYSGYRYVYLDNGIVTSIQE